VTWSHLCPRKARGAGEGQKTMHVFRVGALFNRRNKTKGIDQKGIFDISRAKG